MANCNTEGNGTLIKVIAGVIAGILACVAVFGLGWGITGTPDITKWGKHEVKLPTDGDNDNNDGTHYVSDLEITPDNVVMSAMDFNIAPVSLNMDDASEESIVSASETLSYQVTATAYYDNGVIAFDSDQVFNFSLSWKMLNTNEVSEFVEMQVTDRTATLTLKKCFSTQMLLTCTYALNSEISRTATIDCVDRVTDIKVKFSETSQTITNGSVVDVTFIRSNTVANAAWYMPKFNLFDGYTDGIGTLRNEILKSTAVIELSDDFQAALTEEFSQFCQPGSFSTKTLTGTTAIMASQQELTSMLTNAQQTFTSEVYFTRFQNVLSQQTNQVKVLVTLELKYGGSQTFEYYLNIDFDTTVTSMGMNQTEIIL